MAHFLFGQLRRRRARALVLGAGILIASCAFVLLAASAKTSAIHVRGDVRSNFRAAYDILVRPRGSATPLERRERLVRDNYLSGIFGGITIVQWQKVLRIHGVSVAAPIANLGYILPYGSFSVPITKLINREPVQLYRLRVTWSADAGLSRYPAGDSYVYFTRRDRIVTGHGFTPGGEIVPGHSKPLQVCRGLPLSVPQRPGPFDPAYNTWIDCYSALTPGSAIENSAYSQGLPLGTVGTVVGLAVPVEVAAIDPVQEAKLVGLPASVIRGRYLRESDKSTIQTGTDGYHSVEVPVLAASRTFVGDRLHVQIERLSGFDPKRVPELLASRGAYRFLTHLGGTTIATRSESASVAYEQLLRGRAQFQSAHEFESPNYWTVGPVRYREVGRDTLAPRTTTNPISVWANGLFFSTGGYMPAPPDERDLQFRRLYEHSGSNFFTRTTNTYRSAGFRVVGRFDPDKLRGFSPLSRVPLETYYPPLLEPRGADAVTLLHGRALGPSQNLGGYIQQPPLLLTTIRSLAPFLNTSNYTNVRDAHAPISAIRVRVAGVTGPDALSLARIRAVAVAIHDDTGLDVDITAGSSPHAVTIEMPAGRFGRPALTLSEGWSKKGVSTSFLKALDRQDLALFVLMLAVCALFIANGANATVRTRRSEIGILLTLGWRRRDIFAAVAGELLLVGVAAGTVGAGVAGLVVVAGGLDAEWSTVVLAIPAAIGLAVVGGFVPAWRAARSTPLAAVLPVVAGARRSGRVRRVSVLAATNLLRAPMRLAAGSLTLLLSVGSLTLLVGISRSFQGSLVGTVLGRAISLRVDVFDYVSVGVMAVLAAFGIADIVYLNIRERASELMTLRIVGWEDANLTWLVSLEALGLGVIGGLAGSLVGLVLGIALGLPVGVLAITAAIAGIGGVALSLAASIVPVSHLRRLIPAVVVASE